MNRSTRIGGKCRDRCGDRAIIAAAIEDMWRAVELTAEGVG